MQSFFDPELVVEHLTLSPSSGARMQMTASPASTTPHHLVLVVDDDPDLLALCAEALTRHGHRVATASNGVEALERVEEELPQLILLDMRMPVMDGWSFTKVLRERHGRSIPIVVVTAAEDSRLRADEVGANGSIGKPFDLERLYEVVDDTIAAGVA